MPALSTELQRPSDAASEAAIRCEGLGFYYLLQNRVDDSKSLILDRLRKKRCIKQHWALRGVTFSLQREEILGVIGRNGAGKTTLCGILGGILRADEGEVNVCGRSALLMGGGFTRPDMTGREYLFLNGLLYGFTKEQVAASIPEIASFAGLNAFLDLPLRTYSSGMCSRLAFSLRVMFAPEILIFDESLAVGDLSFNDKAGKLMHHLISTSRLVVVATHDLRFVQEYCTKALFLDHGTAAAFGDPAEVVQCYTSRLEEEHDSQPRPIRHFILKEGFPRAPERKAAITLSDATISYPWPLGSPMRKDDRLVKGDRGHLFEALRGVSFELMEGEILGIIGPNGAGKTTLCRLLAGTFRPDRGVVKVSGTTSILLSLGIGFNQQLSGRDNILLNGLLLGIPKRRLAEKMQEIIEFSGLEAAIDNPVKTYSSGMVSRLAFTIAIGVEPDLLIVDELLSSGDLEFSQRAAMRMGELIQAARAVVVATHDLAFVETVCTKALFLERGRAVYYGDPKVAVARYRQGVTHVPLGVNNS